MHNAINETISFLWCFCISKNYDLCGVIISYQCFLVFKIVLWFYVVLKSWTWLSTHTQNVRQSRMRVMQHYFFKFLYCFCKFSLSKFNMRKKGLLTFPSSISWLIEKILLELRSLLFSFQSTVYSYQSRCCLVNKTS